MAHDKYHEIYSRDADVYLQSGSEKIKAMQAILDLSGFKDNIESVLESSGKSRDEFYITIKPNIMTASVRETPSPVYTDPELVEYLIDYLKGLGFTKIAVVEARNVYDYSYKGRSVKAVAELAGYSEDKGYSIEDLSEQKEPFDYGGVLGVHPVGRAWRDADYRISFAKNKTHWQCYYTGCLKNIYGCLPEWDKMKHYHGKGREFFQCNILILDAFPVHFGFLDAWVSGDGFSGHVRDAKPNFTNTIFASSNILALDWVMGEKMGVDPKKNFVIKEALKFWDMPGINRHGDLTPWKPWTNIKPFTISMLDLFEELYLIGRISSRAFASRQDKRFPPVSRFQWIFGILQRFTQLIERIFVTKT
jgi:uncharacterized protein (DUF362 family)